MRAMRNESSGVKMTLGVDGNRLRANVEGIDWPLDELEAVSALALYGQPRKAILVIAPRGEDFEAFHGSMSDVCGLAEDLWKAIPAPVGDRTWWQDLPVQFQVPFANELLASPTATYPKPVPVAAVVLPAGVTFTGYGGERVNIRWDYVSDVFVGGEDEFRTRFPQKSTFVMFGVFALLGTRKVGRSIITLETTEGPWVFSGAYLPVQTKAMMQPVLDHFATAVPRGAAGGTVADRLRDLAELRDAGVITSEDFEAKKVDLLREL